MLNYVFVLDRLSVFVNIKKILSYRMGQKLSSKLLFIYSPKSDGFYISQGSVETPLSCDSMFSNHFITNFPQNVDKDMDRNLWFTFLGCPVCNVHI